MANPKRPLTEKQKIYAQEIAKGTSSSQAAKIAGYKKTDSCKLKQSPAIQAVLAEARQSVVDVAKFNAQAAYDKCEKAIEFAVATNNANAYAKLVELQMKMAGHLVEKIDVRGQLAPMFIQIEGVSAPKPDDVESEVQ